MQYAQLNEDGSYSHQITTIGNIEWDENNFCSAAALVKDGKADQFRIVELHEAQQPYVDPLTETVMRDGGEYVGGRWQYKWRVEALGPQEKSEKLTDLVRSKAAEIRAQYDSLIAVLEAAYDQKERETWPQQVIEARSFAGDAQAHTPLLDALVGARQSDTKEQLVAKILTNYTNYSRIVGEALGVRQSRMSALHAIDLTTVDVIAQIDSV